MRYDLHIHTNFSRCSRIKPEKLLKIAKKRSLNGIAVTDHNTIKGGLAVSELNKDEDFEVIVGAEMETVDGEILGLYLNEEIKSLEMFEIIDEIKQQGGIAIIAHPTARFRRSLKQPCIELKGRIHGIEAFNSRALPLENWRAQRMASKFKFGVTGGSDAHFYYEIGRGYTEFKGNLREAIKTKSTKVGGSIFYAPIGGALSKLRKMIF